MKKFILTFITSVCIIFSTSTINAATINYINPNITYEYLDNGSYFITTITPLPTARSTNQKSASKTTQFLNSNGNVMWSVTVTATFTYTGTSSTCTNAVASATSYNSDWRITNSYSSRSGSSGTATATAKKYFLSSPIDTVTKSVTLHCDKSGNLY